MQHTLDAHTGNKENYHLLGEDNVETARRLGRKDKISLYTFYDVSFSNKVDNLLNIKT